MANAARARTEAEDVRRQQFVDATIACLADIGFFATTLTEIAKRADLSPGLVAHYFGDKNGLLEATLRYMARRLTKGTAKRLTAARTPSERVHAVIEANLAAEEFDRRTSSVWLAFWGQVIHEERFARVQRVYQRRTTSNLVHALKKMVATSDAHRIAEAIAAVVDGLWLRAALSNVDEPDSALARAAAISFADSQIAAATPRPLAAPSPNRSTGDAPPLEEAKTFGTYNPATGELLAELSIAGPAEVDRAVAAATAGQRAWASMTGAERGRILRRAADLLRARNEDLARLETLDTGKPIQETRAVDVLSGADCLEYFAGLAPTLAGEHVDLGPQAFGYTRREPLGVVAGIGAWNYPLQIACWKAAPALACGNAMIFKPAELTPLSAVKLAEIFTEAGLPDGVFAVVQGFAATGRLLTRHPGVAKISLTGEAGTGKKVMADAAGTLKHVTLELGGKSPLIVFDDANIADAVSAAMLGNFYSNGEICSNASRVFVHAKIRRAFLEALATRTARMVVGDPLDPATHVGALISESHMRKVLGYIDAARAAGARLVTGGHRVETGALKKGWFVAPTVFADCTDDMPNVQDEIFGPVMSVLTFDDEDEVVARANNTAFGLAGGVFTADLARAHRVVARLEAGTCWINQYNVTPIELPFGGYKQSGLGRENSRAALSHYTQIKSVYVNLGAVASPY